MALFNEGDNVDENHLPKDKKDSVKNDGETGCHSKGEALQKFVWNPETETYAMVLSDDPADDLDSTTTSHDTAVIYGHACPCAPVDYAVYCPVDAEWCRIENTTTATGGGSSVDSTPFHVTCQGEKLGINNQLVLSLALFFFLFILVLAFATSKGRQARMYAKKLLGAMNEESYQEHLQQEINQQILEAARRQRRRQLSTATATIRQRRGIVDARNNSTSPHDDSPEPKPKNAVVLRTRVYHKSAATLHDNDGDNDDDTTLSTTDECSICLGELMDGQRVGALPCPHNFHVACLKQWIAKKNKCPLCHTPHLATPTTMMKNNNDNNNNTQTTTDSTTTSQGASTATDRELMEHSDISSNDPTT